MAFTCPRCSTVSHLPKDEEEGYCGRCHDWTAEPERGTWVNPLLLPVVQRQAAAILEAQGILHLRWLDAVRYAAVRPLLFTHSIIVGRISDMTGTDDHWCYRSEAAALGALIRWDGTGEPDGWHRHPRTGRRRVDGDPLLEEIW